MTKLIEWTLDALRQQGLSFMLLAIGIWWAHERLVLQERKIDRQVKAIIECEQRIIEFYETDHRQLIDALNRNSQSIEEIIDIHNHENNR